MLRPAKLLLTIRANYAFDKLLQYKVCSSRSELFGDEISICHQFITSLSGDYIGIKYFGSGVRFTKWRAECWIKEPNTNKETKINGTLEKAGRISSRGRLDVEIISSAISESTILRIEITIIEWVGTFEVTYLK